MIMDDQPDFDRDSYDLASANANAAGIVRQLAAQLERASYQARTIRRGEPDTRTRSQQLEFALVHLAGVMSEAEVFGLINALRHAATIAQEMHVCEFCGSPIEPWAMLTSDGDDEDENGVPEVLIQHSWDQYGVVLCKGCHLSVRQARWQAVNPM